MFLLVCVCVCVCVYSGGPSLCEQHQLSLGVLYPQKQVQTYWVSKPRRNIPGPSQDLSQLVVLGIGPATPTAEVVEIVKLSPIASCGSAS